MSLINEALKRAEAEKNRDGDGLPYEPPPVPHASHVHLPRLWARGLALCGGLVAVTALGMWTMVDKGFWSVTPKAQAADATPDQAPIHAPPNPTPQVRSSIDPVLAKTVEETKYYSPEPTPEPPQPVSPCPTDTATPAVATPTLPPPAPAKREQPKPKPKMPELKLTGVVVGDGRATAIINGQFLAIGDTIQGARVVKITKYIVTLEVHGRRIALRQ